MAQVDSGYVYHLNNCTAACRLLHGWAGSTSIDYGLYKEKAASSRVQPLFFYMFETITVECKKTFKVWLWSLRDARWILQV